MPRGEFGFRAFSWGLSPSLKSVSFVVGVASFSFAASFMGGISAFLGGCNLLLPNPKPDKVDVSMGADMAILAYFNSNRSNRHYNPKLLNRYLCCIG